MKRMIPWIIAAIALIAFGASFSELGKIRAWLLEAKLELRRALKLADHREVRQFEIRSQLAQAGANAVVFVGDSITESAPLPSEVCGHRIVDAGVAGADVRSYLSMIKEIHEFRASAIVIALGTNDSLPDRSLEAFTEQYERLVSFLAVRSQKLVLAGIPPIDPGYISDGYLDRGQGDRINEAIRKIAAHKNLSFLDLRSASGRITSADGVHLSPAGYRYWLGALLDSVCD